MNDYLSKPISMTRLKYLLSQAPSRKSLFNSSDLNKLAKLNAKGLSDLRVELVDAFLSNLFFRIDEMESALKSDDFEKVQECAHSLKSSAGAIGALKLSRVCSKVEGFSIKRDRVTLQKYFYLLKRVIPPTEKVFKAYLNGFSLELHHSIRSS